MLKVISGSLMNNFTTTQELWRMLENSQGQQNVFQGYHQFW